MTGTEYLKQLIDTYKGVKFKNMLDLSKKTGVSQSSLSDFKNGKKGTFELDVAWKILVFLDPTIIKQNIIEKEDGTDINMCKLKEENKKLKEEIKRLELEVSSYQGEIRGLDRQLALERKARIEAGKKDASQQATEDAPTKRMAAG